MVGTVYLQSTFLSLSVWLKQESHEADEHEHNVQKKQQAKLKVILWKLVWKKQFFQEET